MRELSLHILDIMENSVGAGATFIDLMVIEKDLENRLEVRIRDNGWGMPPHMLKEVTNPFFTTRTTRRVGLGLSLFQEAAKRCEGEFHIRSREGEGTEVTASFRRDHIDLAPMGDMGSSLTSLIMGNPGVDVLYTHEVDGRVFSLDTREVKKELEDVPLNHPEVIRYLTQVIRDGLEELKRA